MSCPQSCFQCSAFSNANTN